MTLNQFALVLRQYWRSIVAVALTIILATVAVTMLTPKQYTASSTLFLTVNGAGSASELNQGSSYTERQVASYAKVATSAMVLDPVISSLHLPETTTELAKELTVSSPSNTSLLQVSVTQPTAEGAKQVADAVANQLVASVTKLSTSTSQALVKATVTDPAAVPESPSSPKWAQNIALGLVLALLLGIGQAVLRRTLDTRVRSTADVADTVDEALLGTISRTGVRSKKSGYGYGYGASTNPVDEDLRRLRTNLRFLGLGTTRLPYLVITSATALEGKTYTSTGLARVLTEAGSRILLIDADLRRPMVSEWLDIDGSVGLSQVLSGQLDLPDAIQTAPDGFDVIPAGPIPPNPAELLGQPRMRAALEALSHSYDLILIDSSPVLPVTDGVVLAELAGSAVLVARADKVTRPQLRMAADSVTAGGGEVLGIILNDVDPRHHLHGEQYYRSRVTTAEEGANDAE